MSDDFIKCTKDEGDCPCEDCSDQDVPMEAGPAKVGQAELGQPSRILKPGQDPRTVDLDGKARAGKCFEAIKIVCQQFDCTLEAFAIIKHGNVQTAISCTPVQHLTEGQLAAINAAKAVQ